MAIFFVEIRPASMFPAKLCRRVRRTSEATQERIFYGRRPLRSLPLNPDLSLRSPLAEAIQALRIEIDLNVLGAAGNVRVQPEREFLGTRSTRDRRSRIRRPHFIKFVSDPGVRPEAEAAG